MEVIGVHTPAYELLPLGLEGDTMGNRVPTLLRTARKRRKSREQGERGRSRNITRSPEGGF